MMIYQKNVSYLQDADKKMRPALIVSLNVRNRLANDVIVVPTSTTLRKAPTHVEGELDFTGKY